jgi:hypothetical protein
MGWRYVRFRALFELKRKTGVLKEQFPTQVEQQSFIRLKEWQQLEINYFFESRESLNIQRRPSDQLKQDVELFQSGQLIYFNAKLHHIGRDYDWLTNPSNGYQYDQQKHWLDIPDLSEAAGDIKYVWEKSRFSYLYALVRYDYHFQKDQSETVLQEIESWIQANPTNRGPNWRCSQEISLRVLNWLFVLQYYKYTPALTEKRFQQIMHSIYWQLKHVYANIDFSRIAVRNNHAITETLMLYLGGLLFPFFPEAASWKTRGKAWFEQEIEYQIYEDGTFLQFSHNYHRVVIQLLTKALYLAELNGERFKEVVYERARKSLNYLYQCTEKSNGHLPNYGANDGALFFKLNDCSYRDYRPQLNALYYFFSRDSLFQEDDLQEDIDWYSSRLKQQKTTDFQLEQHQLNEFPNGGYYTMRDADSFTFIKCGSYKDRPSHADNLHIDIWYKGENILRDAGTYQYNTTPELVRYFNGTSAHNTVTIGDKDQMLKGPRFIWFNWSKALSAELIERTNDFYFKGSIQAFQQIDKNSQHIRTVVKDKRYPVWHIKDQVKHNTELPIQQYWNISSTFDRYFRIEAIDEKGESIAPKRQKGFYSSRYGEKEETEVIVFSTSGKVIQTKITNQ